MEGLVTWTLLLIIAFSATPYPKHVAAEIPGFASEEACRAAGWQWQMQVSSRRIECVPNE
jgi:hypothetical protein